MKTSKVFLLVLVLSICAVFLSSPVQGEIATWDFTFSEGGLPTDFGWGESNQPGCSGSVDTEAGLWVHDSSVSSGHWTNYTGTRLFDGFEEYAHGFARIKHYTIGNNPDKQTILYTARKAAPDASIQFQYDFLPGKVSLKPSSYPQALIEVANEDGEFHTYGWEVHFPTHTIRLFFDDLPIGDPDGYYTWRPYISQNSYFGDGTGSAGPHKEDWDRWYAADGHYPAIPVLPGDANRNGVVSEIDAAILAANWLQTDKVWGDGDFNGDGVVNDIDATMMATNWLRGTPANAAVPEPAQIFLILTALGSLSLIHLTRRRS